MSIIERTLQEAIQKCLFKGKAILLFGARQCGKSTLVETLLTGMEYLYMNGDDNDVREILTNTSATKLKAVAGKKKIVLLMKHNAFPISV